MTSRITIEPQALRPAVWPAGCVSLYWDVLTWLAGAMTEQQIPDDYREREPVYPDSALDAPDKGRATAVQILSRRSAPAQCRP